MAQKEKINGCLAFKMASIEVYSQLLALFPEEKDFWTEMIEEEKKHSKFLVAGDFFRLFGEEIGQIPLPPLHVIEDTIICAENMLRRLQWTPVSLEDALRMALLLEGSSVERFLFELASDDSDSSLISIKKHLVDDIPHADKLREFMIKKGFMRVS